MKYQEKILVLQQKVIVGKQIEGENITGTYISRDQTMKDKTSSWGCKYWHMRLYKVVIMSPTQRHRFILWNKQYSEWERHTKEIKEVAERYDTWSKA